MKNLLVILFLIVNNMICASEDVLAKTKARNIMHNNALEVSAIINPASAGVSAEIANSSVMRIYCTANGIGGTGFLHKSGVVLTAAHVVANCNPKDLILILPNNQQVAVKSYEADVERDVAFVTPEKQIIGEALQLGDEKQFAVGKLVTAWGFPAGYNGIRPMLTVGYLSGVDGVLLSDGKTVVARWVVNAAFNGGNSGGPVLDANTGTVIGMVSSKLAPIPPIIESALVALSNQSSGFMYQQTLPDGTKKQVSEGQVISDVLKYLRSQTQLVIGHSVVVQDIKTFLSSKGVAP